MARLLMQAGSTPIVGRESAAGGTPSDGSASDAQVLKKFGITSGRGLGPVHGRWGRIYWNM